MKRIPLTRGLFALVDDQDFEWLKQWKWFADASGYPARDQHLGKVDGKYKSERILMHRLIMDTPEGMDTDHINRNRADNQRKNLRVCTHASNMRNTGVRSDNKSGHKGVSWFARDNKWRARIVIDGKYRHLGYFEDKDQAGRVYQLASENGQ